MTMRSLMKLNIGGQIFEADPATLKQSLYLRDLYQPGTLLIEDGGSSSLFIDRDPEIFQDIMHYLQTWEVRPTDEHYLGILKSEAIFFGIDGLVKKINQMLSETALSDKLFKKTYTSKPVDYLPVGFSTSKFDTSANETLVQAFTYAIGQDRHESKIVVKNS